MEANELQQFLILVEGTLRTIQEYFERNDDIQVVLLHTQLLIRDVVMLEGLVLPEIGEVLLNSVMEVAVCAQNISDEYHLRSMRGRPQVAIPEEHLSILLEHHFSIKAIADMFRVSPRTIRRRISQYGLDEQLLFSEVSDVQLDSITREFVATHPMSGQRSFDGFLSGLGLKV